MGDAVSRSYVADGRCVGWYGAPGWVVDAELSDQQVPPALAKRHGVADFHRRWTRAECAAKLADVPIVLWLREHGLDMPSADFELHTFGLDDLVVTVGRWAPEAARHDTT